MKVPSLSVQRGDKTFLLTRDPSGIECRDAFLGEAEAATVAFFDATLPRCARMIDLGAYVGSMSLYAASLGAEVHAIEASPVHRTLLERNLALNPDLAERIAVHPVAVGDRDGTAQLFSKSIVDSGTSVFQTIERAHEIRARPAGTVPQRSAASLLSELGLDHETLLKIDVEGAEYSILPAISGLLARHLPFVVISFHPFNLVGADPYQTSVARLRAGLNAAMALAFYPFLYLPPLTGGTGWRVVEQADRAAFLHYHLPIAKPVPNIGSRQSGLVGVIGCSKIRLPELECGQAHQPDQAANAASTADARSRM